MAKSAIRSSCAESLLLVKVLLKLNLLLASLFQALAEHLDVGTPLLTLLAQVVEGFVVLAADRVSHISKHVRVFCEPVRVLKIRKLSRWLDAMLRTHLLIIVLSVGLLTRALLNVVTKKANVLNQVHIVAHDENVVGFVDLTFNL